MSKEGKKSNSDLKIMEWRFNQFLGEKLTYEQIKSDPENESFLVTDVKFSSDGNNVVVSDKGGRVIIFKKSEQKGKQPKLDYFFEFPAQEKDFDVQKSIYIVFLFYILFYYIHFFILLNYLFIFFLF